MADKKKRTAITEETRRPYSNMGARKAVLMIGLALTIAAAALVVVGALNIFLMPNMFGSDSPLDIILYLLAGGVIVAFVGVVFSVAGANTSKPLARLSFFLGINAFILGMGMLIVMLLFFKAIIPLPGLEGFLGTK